MPVRQFAVRDRRDRCPGVLRLTEAADGWLARVRLPGGFVSATGIAALADAAADLGDGRCELTSRGNVQLRGLAADAGVELGARLHDAGLWPSQTHERVRNVVASPLAGLDSSVTLTGLVHDLDEALCATPRLAALSGRFLFSADDGRGDMTMLGADVQIGHRGLDVPNGEPAWVANGLAVTDPVAAALCLAVAFLDERESQASDAWRVGDLIEGQVRVRVRASLLLGDSSRGGGRIPLSADRQRSHPGPSGPTSMRGTAGLLDQIDGGQLLVLAVPLGRLDRDQLRWLAGIGGSRSLRVTPWRTIVIPDATRPQAVAADRLGFGVTPDSPWLEVSACAGQPGCASALADVQTDARAAMGRWPGRVVRWSGCERRCGRGGRTEIDVIATRGGYRIEGADA
jgi:precorrin-3B synthase